MLDEIRMRTACFARAPQRCTSRLSKHFLLTFQEVTPLSKTRNQLDVLCPSMVGSLGQKHRFKAGNTVRPILAIASPVFEAQELTGVYVSLSDRPASYEYSWRELARVLTRRH